MGSGVRRVLLESVKFLSCGLLTACGLAAHPPQRTYSQTVDSATSGCARGSPLCVPQPGEQFPVIPAPRPLPHPPALPGPSSTALTIATAAKVTQVTIDASLMARIRKALTECADDARSEVLLKYFGGRGPTHAECTEVVGTDAHGEPITRAMQLGVEQHHLALKCAQEALEELKPGGFSLTPRYRLELSTGKVQYLSQQQVQELLSTGRSAELRGSIEPDIVIHAGQPLQVQGVFDFKFPCVNGGTPNWRKYPSGHAHEGLFQSDVYKKFLGTKVFRIIPRHGVLE